MRLKNSVLNLLISCLFGACIFIAVPINVYSAIPGLHTSKYNKELSDLYRELGIKFEEEGNFSAAEVQYLESLVNNSEDIYTLFNIGHLYLKINKPDKALKYLKELERISPFDCETLNLLGIAYSGIGKKKESLSCWEKSLILDPTQTKVQKMIEEFKEIK